MVRRAVLIETIQYGTDRFTGIDRGFQLLSQRHEPRIFAINRDCGSGQ